MGGGLRQAAPTQKALASFKPAKGLLVSIENPEPSNSPNRRWSSRWPSHSRIRKLSLQEEVREKEEDMSNCEMQLQ